MGMPRASPIKVLLKRRGGNFQVLGWISGENHFKFLWDWRGLLRVERMVASLFLAIDVIGGSTEEPFPGPQAGPGTQTTPALLTHTS